MINAVGNLIPGAIRFDAAQATQVLRTDESSRSLAINDTPSLPRNSQQVLPPASYFESNLASSSGFPFQLSAAEFSDVFGIMDAALPFANLLPGLATFAYTQSSMLTASRVNIIT